MLSVVPIKSSNISNGYYTKQDGGYYIENAQNKDLYQWFGKGAAKLNLTGGINLNDHKNIYKGELPDGTLLGKRDENGVFVGRSGYDLTFSANKDISLIICCTKDEGLRKQLIELHHDAVKESLGYLESHISARVTQNKKTEYQTTGNMVASMCTHFSSRADDPDIHTHALLANLTECSDGKWRALATDMSRKQGTYELIRDNATLLGNIYQNKMEIGVREIGFSTEKIYKHGMFKITGFPDEMREHFSKRREQITSIVSSMRNANANDKKIFFEVTKNSRMHKKATSTKDFIDLSKKSMDNYLKENESFKGFDGLLNDIKTKSISPIEVSEDLRDTLGEAMDKLSEFSVRFSETNIIHAVLNQRNEKPFKLEAIVQAIKDAAKNGEIIQSEGMFEKPESIEFKKKISAFCEKNKHNLSIHTEPKNAKSKLDALDAIISQEEALGRKVLIIAANKHSVSDHNAYSRSLQKTIWQKLAHLGKLDRAISAYSFINDLENRKITHRHTIIIDDAQRSKLSTMTDILEKVEQKGCKVIFSEYNQGRRAQLPGNALDLIKQSNIQSLHVADLALKQTICDMQKHVVPLKEVLNQTKDTRLKEKHDAIIDYAKEKGMKHVNIVVSGIKERDVFTKSMRSAISNEGHSINVKTYERCNSNHIRNISPGMLIKTYAGHGRYIYEEIKHVDKANGLLTVPSLFNKNRRISFEKLAKNMLVKEKTINLADGDVVKLTGSEKITKQMGIKEGIRYQIKLSENKKKVMFNPLDGKDKAFNVASKHLDGIQLEYAYAKTFSELESTKHIAQEAIISAPDYGLKSSITNDIQRIYQKVSVFCFNDTKLNITDNKKPTKNQVDEVKGEKCPIDYAVKTISSRQSTFDEKSILEKALYYNQGVGGKDTSKALSEKLSKAIDKKNLLKSPSNHSLVTSNAVLKEISIISEIKSNKNSLPSLMQRPDVVTFLEKTNLTEGQKSACEMVATTKDQHNIIQGYAGTGKSTMMQTLKDMLTKSKAIEADGIIALAPTHAAVKELHKKNMSSSTIHRFLIDQKKSPKDLNGKVIIVDEMSMIGTNLFKDLAQAVSGTTARVVWVGDNEQLKPVPSGAPSKMAYISKEADINTAVMQDIKRQKTQHMKVAVDLLVKKDVAGALSQIKTEEQVLTKEEEIILKGDKAKEGFLLKNKSIEACADAFLALDDKGRQETLVITPSNELREELNDLIRSGLLKEGRVHGKAAVVDIYINKHKTEQENKESFEYKINDVVQYNSSYFRVKEVNHKENSIIVSNGSTTKCLNLDASQLSTFYDKKIEVQAGDWLKWTATDAKRDIVANTKMQVLKVKDNSIIEVLDENKKAFSIDLNLEQNKRIDYAYATTVYGAQGTTSKYVLCLLNSNSSLANSLGMMYVALSRATHDFRLFTQNFDDLMASIKNHDDKQPEQIALKTINRLVEKEDSLKPSERNDVAPFVQSKPGETFIDAETLKASLRDQATLVCQHVLGNPNKSQSSASNWRYGKKGSLSVFVSGSRQGTYCNFETGEGGDMLSLVKNELGLDFKDALKYSAQLIHFTPDLKPVERISRKQTPKIVDEAPDPKKIAKAKYAQNLIDRSKPIDGTVVEKYLNSRGIDTSDKASLGDIRYIAKMKTGGGNSHIRPFSSAMMVISRDENGKPQAIQVTYLDPVSGKKVKGLDVPKRTLTITQLSGSVVSLNKSKEEKSKYLFAAEGVETALSIKNVLEKNKIANANVVATLGISNFSNLNRIGKPEEIVLVLDNDGANAASTKAAQKAINNLKDDGLKVSSIKPTEMLEGKKTDYNDLLQAGKMKQIEQDIKRIVDQKTNNISRPEKLNTTQNPEPAKADREII